MRFSLRLVKCKRNLRTDIGANEQEGHLMVCEDQKSEQVEHIFQNFKKVVQISLRFKFGT